jgi:chromate transport protein ChrA
MIIAGTIIFGGGPVVIPLLRDYVVAEGVCVVDHADVRLGQLS